MHLRFGTIACLLRRLAAALVLAGLGGLTCASAQQQLMLPPPPAADETAAPAAPPAVADGLDAVKTAIDDIDKNFGAAAGEDALVELKRRLAPLHDQLRDRIGQLEPRLKQIEQRAAQLGFPPEKPGSEEAVVAQERTRLTAERGETEGALAQSKVLADRATDLDERINQRRRELFAGQLFARGPSLFAAGFWRDLAQSGRAEFARWVSLQSLWKFYARANATAASMAAVLAILGALTAAAWLATRWLRRLTAAPPRRPLAKALAAMAVLIASTVTLPALLAAAVLTLRNFGLMPATVVNIGFGLAVAAAAAGFGRGVALALFAPRQPERRLIAFADDEAETYAAHLTWAARVFGVALFVNGLHQALGSPVAPIIVTGELLAVAILAIVVHLLWRISHAAFRDAATSRRTAWLRVILGLIALAITGALAFGYESLAVFIASRLLAALVLGGAVAVVMAFIDTLLAETLTADSLSGRRIAAAFGLSPRGLDLIATVASALQRVVLIGLAMLAVLSFGGIFVEDFFSAFRQAGWDFAIGDASLSLATILSALALLLFGGLAIRMVQRWLATKFLPRTGLDAGLQNSILSLFGYGALIALGALALGALGIDLQKIALIAGALSVGIGFGLQAVVANFISGIILLAERSVRVGDWVVVRNEEGWVRRISIRATEIETFDRASVIIPNQEFITSAVKNWTHGSTVGRIVVKVRVGYDSDAAKVREILLGCANRHPQVLQRTSPAVYLTGFGDIGLDFELRCLIGNIEQSPSVRDDLNMEILRRFRDARIRIPSPVHVAQVPGLPPEAPEIRDAAQ